MLVSAGGVCGSLTRFVIDLFFEGDRPAITTANLIGSGLAGFLLVLMERRGITSARYFLLPGFCGGMTTFSSVAFESMRNTHENYIFLLANTLGSLLAVACAITAARRFVKVRG